MASPSPDRHDPLPSLPELPGYLLRKAARGHMRAAVVVVVLVVVAGTGVGAMVVTGARRDERARTAAEEERRATAARERRKREAVLTRVERGAGPASRGLEGSAALRARRALVAALEADVLADARSRLRTGELRARGRFRFARCARFPKGLDARPPQDDLALRVARYECLAVLSVVERSERTTGALIGRPFRARVEFPTGRYAWCMVVQRPGELSASAELARDLPRACGGS